VRPLYSIELPGVLLEACVVLIRHVHVPGNRVKHYVWDGRRIRAVDPAVLRNGETRQDRLSASLAKFRGAAYDAIFPNPSSVRPCASVDDTGCTLEKASRLIRNPHCAHRSADGPQRLTCFPFVLQHKALMLCMRTQVTPDYWHYVSWRASHRLFSSMLGIFATQSLLSAVGIGAQRSLPAAAAINWVLKDGLGRLGRLGVAAAFGQSFDADVKVIGCSRACRTMRDAQPHGHH